MNVTDMEKRIMRLEADVEDAESALDDARSELEELKDKLTEGQMGTSLPVFVADEDCRDTIFDGAWVSVHRHGLAYKKEVARLGDERLQYLVDLNVPFSFKPALSGLRKLGQEGLPDIEKGVLTQFTGALPAVVKNGIFKAAGTWVVKVEREDEKCWFQERFIKFLMALREHGGGEFRMGNETLSLARDDAPVAMCAGVSMANRPIREDWD